MSVVGPAFALAVNSTRFIPDGAGHPFRKLGRSPRRKVHIICRLDPTGRKNGDEAQRSAAAKLLERAARGAEGARDRASRARDAYLEAAQAARELEETEFGGVLGADFGENTVLGRVSETQDLLIPEGPAVAPLSTSLVRAALYAHAREVSSEEDAERLAQGLLRLLQALRLCVGEIEDRAEVLFSDNLDAADSRAQAAVSSLQDLLAMGGFHCNDPPELRPRALNAFPMKVAVDGKLDVTIYGSSQGYAHPIVQGSERKLPQYFPHVFVAYRGTGVKRESGLLLGTKLSALEAYYLGFVSAPLRFIRKRLFDRPRQTDATRTSHEVAEGGNSGIVENQRSSSLVDEVTGSGSKRSTRRGGVVRRVFPSAKFSGWAAAKGFFLPVFTQEPTSRFVCVSYRTFSADAAAAREARKQRLFGLVRELVARALEPTKYRNKKQTPLAGLDCDEQCIGSYGPMRLELWREVPWGHISHILPGTVTKLNLTTRDLLRVDLLTFAGLMACVVTIARDSSSSLIWAQLAGTVGVYGARIALRLRQALSMNAGRLAQERQELKFASDGAAMRAIGSMAVEQQFSVVAPLLASKVLGRQTSLEQLQRVASGGATGSSDEFDSWMERMERWGLLDASRGLESDNVEKNKFTWH